MDSAATRARHGRTIENTAVAHLDEQVLSRRVLLGHDAGQRYFLGLRGAEEAARHDRDHQGRCYFHRAFLEPVPRELMDLRDKNTLELLSTGAISCRSDDLIRAESARRDLSVFYGCVLAVTSLFAGTGAAHIDPAPDDQTFTTPTQQFAVAAVTSKRTSEKNHERSSGRGYHTCHQRAWMRHSVVRLGSGPEDNE